MDLSVSPDINAFWSYLVILVIGLFVAHRQVSSRLEGFKGIWQVGDTWLLFFAYLIIPFGLFWLLDRTDAIKDTSLFAAMLVAVGYERILSGSNETISAPQKLTGLWSPFVSYTNRVAERIRNEARRADRRLQKRLVNNIVKAPAKLEALEQLAKSLATDVTALGTELRKVDNEAALGSSVNQERKAVILYEEVRANDDYLYELKDKALIEKWWYYWHAYQLRNKLTAVIVFVLLAAPSFYALSYASLYKLETQYTLWRLVKPNTSTTDLYRAQHRYATLLQDTDRAEFALQELVSQLHTPETTISRVELLLQIALNNRCDSPASRQLPGLLPEALTAASPDTRLRVQQALLYLAEYQTTPVPQALKEWAPSNGDSVTDLQRHIEQWRSYWVGKNLTGCGEQKAEN